MNPSVIRHMERMAMFRWVWIGFSVGLCVGWLTAR